jgi:rubrerythrin
MTTFNNIDLINQQGPHDRDKRWICRECGTNNAVGDACPCGNETE